MSNVSNIWDTNPFVSSKASQGYTVIDNITTNDLSKNVQFSDPKPLSTIKVDRIELKGEDLGKRLTRIENVLQMPTRDVTMEEKYADLRALADQYNAMLESLRSWDILQNN